MASASFCLFVYDTCLQGCSQHNNDGRVIGWLLQYAPPTTPIILRPPFFRLSETGREAQSNRTEVRGREGDTKAAWGAAPPRCLAHALTSGRGMAGSPPRRLSLEEAESQNSSESLELKAGGQGVSKKWGKRGLQVFESWPSVPAKL